MLKALIVEDDILLANRISNTISKNFKSVICYDGSQALKFLNKEKYDIIIADVILPKLNIIEIINYLKNNEINIPVLAVAHTEYSEEKSKIMNYNISDYFIINNNINEINEVIDNIMKRFNNKKENTTISYKNIVINTSEEVATAGDVILENIKGKYFDLLSFFVINNNIILKKEEIFERVWGINSETTINAIEVYISGLRKELKKVGCDKYLKTIRGIGYTLA